MIKLFIRFIQFILRIKKMEIRKFRLKEFRQNAVVGKNFNCGIHARCVNESKEPHKIKIGHNVEILGQLESQYLGTISIGNYVTIRGYSQIRAVKNISIGNNVIISNHVIITDNNNHPVSPLSRKKMTELKFSGESWKWNKSKSRPVVIGDTVWIGEYATILKGVNIGKGAIIGTMAVVTKNVPRYTIVAGNPARVVKKIEP